MIKTLNFVFENSSLMIAFGGGVPMLFALSGNYEEMDFDKTMTGEEKSSTDKKEVDKQVLLSLFQINIIRYALSLDNAKAEDLDPFFLVDFMTLPDNYFLADAPQKYGKFLSGLLLGRTLS